jgi:hypothetical protein
MSTTGEMRIALTFSPDADCDKPYWETNWEPYRPVTHLGASQKITAVVGGVTIVPEGGTNVYDELGMVVKNVEAPGGNSVLASWTGIGTNVSTIPPGGIVMAPTVSAALGLTLTSVGGNAVCEVAWLGSRKNA